MTCDVDEPIWLRATLTYPATETEAEKPIPPEDVDKVVCTVLKPKTKDETSTPEVVDDVPAKGKYKARFAPTTHDKWWFAFDAYDKDGEILARAESEFMVRKSKVPRD